KRLDLLAFQLLAHDLLVPRTRPHREPLLRGTSHYWERDAGFFCCCAASPSSYAFLISGFFHSMIASDRSFSRYLWNSTCRLSVNTRSPICSRACSKGSVWAPVDDSSLRI